MKKLIAVILAFTLLFSFTVIPTHAESTIETLTPTLENDISVDSTNSFGGLISQTINSEMEKQLENNGFNVFSVEYSEGEALVELEALQDCTLFVGIYSEDGTKLVTSQNIEVTRDDTLVTLTFDTSLVPTYFIIQAYLINTDDLKPLCNVYNSNIYTQEMQEFLAKTADDFEEDKILQLDDDKTNNFAVYNDTVEIIEENLEMTVTADEEKGVYTITNPTDEVSALQIGDIFSYNYDNGEVLILKIASISTDGNGTITYTEGELELEDVFDYVKIDSEAPTNSATVDTSDLDDSIVYNGCIENPSTYSLVDTEVTSKFSHEYEFFDYDLVNAESDEGAAKTTISGSLGFEISAKFKVYIALNKSTVEIKFDYKLTPSIELSTSVKGYIPLGEYTISPIVGLYVSVEPAFVIEFSGKISFSGSILGSVGFKLDTEIGISDISKTPRIETEFKAEATVFVGLLFKPSVKILSDKFVKSSIDAVIGGEIKAVTSAKITTDDERHICNNCLGGEIYAKFDLKYNIKLLNKDKWDFKYTIVNVKFKITDFYFSGDFFEFDLTKCPHKEYRLTVNVKDNNGKTLNGISVKAGDKAVATNTFGNANFFLPDGEYTLKIVNDKYIPVSKNVTVDGKAQKIKINLSLIANGSGGGGGSAWGDSVVSTSANKLSLSSGNSAIITKDGSLYTWGTNFRGELGDGTGIDSYKPQKIMDNVASVSLYGDANAAIDNDGSLYTWGYNSSGRLGNGTTTDSYRPQKIMDNVVSVSLGSVHSAAITKDGSLYIWGDNQYGQLGNGTITKSLKPQKIMDNVVSVSLGNAHTAAIKKDGSLYIWGCNGAGRLGNGTTTNSTRPIKILDNVSTVSLGNYHSAAITKDGSLYTWGSNSCGQLGNGTTTNSTRPIKIMDNVASVSLFGDYSAAIKKDGSLYIWGDNEFGQLGDGHQFTFVKTPVKILCNAASVIFLGPWSGAAITKDDSLYTWGSNVCGQLGIGTAGDGCYKPQKIMDNVVSVSFSEFHGAAITKDGSLYTWGLNEIGQLGNGTTTDSTTPIKITLPKTTTYSLRNSTTTPNEFSGLIPNFIYNYYVMESDMLANPLNAQNLKFIGQAVSDEYGNLTLPEYTANIASTEPTIVLKEFTRVSGELEYLISSEGTAIITGCTAKNVVAIPEKLGDYIPTAIANMAFEGCYNLTDVTLTNSITEIADGTFYAQDNINLHSSCKNNNTYFEEFANQQEIDFSLIHQFGENVLNETPTAQKDGSITHVCANCNHKETLSLPYLKFKPTLNIVNGELFIIFKLPNNILVNNGYENIGFTFNDNAIEPDKVDDYVYISSAIDYKNYDYKLSASILAEACGQSFETNCSESVSSIADINSDTKFNILDLIRMKKNIITTKESDINGDDSTNSIDLVLLRKLLLFKVN